MLGRPVAAQTAAIEDYQAWRNASLAKSWARFSDTDVDRRDVLDFGCGNGPLSLFLAMTRDPESITGVDLYVEAVERARRNLAALDPAPVAPVRFVVGGAEGMPLADAAYDSILAFDCLEHVMEPEAILAEWARVLRPGGKVLIEWFPFRGPFGPHMDALIPIPWAHVLFGERALFEACEALYDDPAFQPRHWDLDALGDKLPNKWRQWRRFAEQGYVNELTTAQFRELAAKAGFRFLRFERHGLFGNRPVLRKVTGVLARLPWAGEYLTSHVIVELQKG